MNSPLTKPKKTKEEIKPNSDSEEEEEIEIKEKPIVTKPKKKMVASQLENLKKGREKLKEVWDLKKNIDAMKAIQKTKSKVICNVRSDCFSCEPNW